MSENTRDLAVMLLIFMIIWSGMMYAISVKAEQQAQYLEECIKQGKSPFYCGFMSAF
jgi:hypothetical protein